MIQFVLGFYTAIIASIYILVRTLDKNSGENDEMFDLRKNRTGSNARKIADGSNIRKRLDGDNRER